MSHNAWALIALVALAGCPKDETEEETLTAPSTVAPETTTPPPETTATLTPETPSSGIESLAKAELDGKDPDPAHKGPGYAVTGSKASFVLGSGWTTKPQGTAKVASASDQKGSFTGTSIGSATADAKRDEAATALGLTECQWSTPESISMGKDKLATTVYDGACKQGDKDVKAVAAAIEGEKVVAVGAWPSEGGDSKTVFNIFRSVKVVSGTGDPTGLAACCAALRQNAASAPLHQKGNYIAAAGACDAARKSAQGRQALAGVRAALAGANVPAACR